MICQLAMGNRSPGARRNRLIYERQSSTRSNDSRTNENDYDKSNINGELINNTNEREQTRNEERIDTCHPAANSPLQVESHNRSIECELESLTDLVQSEGDADKSDVHETVDNSVKTNSWRDVSESKQKVCKPTGPMEFILVLDCVPENSQRVETIKFVENCLKTVPELKQGIEDEFGIPTCCQSVYLENTQLGDQHSLQFYRVRDGDTLHVHYNSEADVDDILDIVGSLCSMVTYIEGIQPILSHGKPSQFLTKSIPENIFAAKVESLAVQYFYPCSTERANANRLLFVQRGGLDIMHKVHELLLLQPWKNVPIEMQYLEHAILRVLWNITASFLIRSLVLQRPTLKAIMKSFLRVEVPKEGLVKAPENQFSFPSILELNRITSEVVYKAAGSLCK